MVQTSGMPTPDDFRRLEGSLNQLRSEVELLHHQQAYLQLQVSALQDNKTAHRSFLSSKQTRLRKLIVMIAKRNFVLFRIAIRVSRFLRR